MCLVNEGSNSKEEIQKPLEPDVEMLPTEESLLSKNAMNPMLAMMMLDDPKKTEPSKGMLPLLLMQQGANGKNGMSKPPTPVHSKSFSTKKLQNVLAISCSLGNF